MNVTIIMPAYNAEKYMVAAIESVVNQTYQDWELIIIDDCSTDNTLNVADKYAKNDNRIKILKNDRNIGVGATRNRGIKEATSKWIAFLDSDDIWEADKLEKQLLLALEKENASLFYTGSGFIQESGERIDYIMHVPTSINRKRLLKQNLISCSSVLVKKDVMKMNLMPEQSNLHEDYTSWLRILDNEDFAYGIDEPLLIYRIAEGSKSRNKFKAAKMNWNAYRFAGLKPVVAAYYMCWYALKSLKKYSHLH